jgi:hypothetical protein
MWLRNDTAYRVSMHIACVWSGRKRKEKAMSHVTCAQMFAIKAKLQIPKFPERATLLNMEALVSTVYSSSWTGIGSIVVRTNGN